MRRFLLPLVLTFSLCAQTTVYLRASAPAAQSIVNATNATPMVIQTAQAHGFASSCNTTTNVCYCGVWGVPTGVGSSPANGIRECVYVDATHLALYDGPLGSAGTAIAGTGNWNIGYNLYPNTTINGQWVGLLTPYTLPAGNVGLLDGTNGDLTRRLSLGPLNGLTSLVVSGGSGGSCASLACTITVVTSYDPTSSSLSFPVAAGQLYAIHGTRTNLDICGSGGGAHSPYTMSSVSTGGWVSTGVTCAGLTTGNYTYINNVCGPASTPNGTIGGTQSCTRVSQLAYTGNPWWDGMLASTTYLNSSPAYKHIFDGGAFNYHTGNGSIMGIYAVMGLQFLVDPSPVPSTTSSLPFEECSYSLTHTYREGNGVNFTTNAGAGVVAADYTLLGTWDLAGLGLSYGACGSYLSTANAQAFRDQMYNDVDDSTHVCSTANVDESNPANHNWVLGSGLAQSGTNDATHVTLAASDSQASGYYVNTEIMLRNGGENFYGSATYGLITAYNASTKVATVAGGWQYAGNPGGASGAVPKLDNIASGTYTSGLSSCTGSTGQYVGMSLGTNGAVYVAMTGTNSITGSSPLVVIEPGSGFTTGAYSASYQPTLSTAACPGFTTATLSIVAGTPYTIFDTVTESGTAVTFTKTNSLSGSINAGDGIMGYNGWAGEMIVGGYLSYVSSVGSNSLTVIDGGSSAVGSTPMMAWRIPQWTAGDCGRIKAARNIQGGAIGSPNIDYPPVGGPPAYSKYGATNGYIQETYANGGGSSTEAFDALDSAMAPYDSRAVRSLSRTQGFAFDYIMRPLMDYNAGFDWDGARYGWDSSSSSPAVHSFLLRNMTEGTAYPNFYGTWLDDVVRYRMFNVLPDLQGGGISAFGWGGSGTTALSSPTGVSTVFAIGLTFDAPAVFAPHGASAKYWRNWMAKVSAPGSYPTFNYWTGNLLDVEPAILPVGFLFNDPRVGNPTCSPGDTTCDYTTQPHQYAFNVSSSALCNSLTGWPCGEYRGDMVASRTGWTSLTDSLMLFAAQTFNNGSYSVPDGGQLSFYKAGCLLGADSNPCNGMWAVDPSVVSDTLHFGSAGLSIGAEFTDQIGVFSPTPITAWGAANAGSLGVQYGDASSRYAYACTNTASVYNTSSYGIYLNPAYANRCIVHFKKSGNDEFLAQLDDVAIAPAGCSGGGPYCTSQIDFHEHYWQTGQTEAGTGLTGGRTFCVNSSYAQVDCATLNTNRLIESIESGGNTPTSQYGLMTHFDCLGTVTLNWDTPGSYSGGVQPQACAGGACGAVNTYPGGAGYTDRVTIAGGSSVGANVTGMTSLIEHKVMQSLTDTMLSTTALNPDANWTGVQMCGATSCAVFVGAIGGTTHSTLTNFTTTHPGTAQYLIGGLTAGNYTVTVGGVPRFSGAVAAGDNSVEFDSAAGTVVVSQTSTTGGTVVSGNGRMSGNVIIH